MPKRSKAYMAAAAKIEEGRFYTPAEAVTLVKETTTSSNVTAADRYTAVDRRKVEKYNIKYVVRRTS